MTSKCKSEGNLFLTCKKAPDTDDLYDPSLIGVTYNEKNSEISLYVIRPSMSTYSIQKVCEIKPAVAANGDKPYTDPL